MTAITETEKVEVRRHCGYPVLGGAASGFAPWRFNQSFGMLEYRLNNMAVTELDVLRTYLGTLLHLEAAIPRSSESLDTNQAAVWYRNPNECRDRQRLFDDWRLRLCAFLGIPPGPGLRTGSPNLLC